MTKYIKAFFIFVRHGINHFAKLKNIKKKCQKRFTHEEKQWFIDIQPDERSKEYIKYLFNNQK